MIDQDSLLDLPVPAGSLGWSIAEGSKGTAAVSIHLDDVIMLCIYIYTYSNCYICIMHYFKERIVMVSVLLHLSTCDYSACRLLLSRSA